MFLFRHNIKGQWSIARTYLNFVLNFSLEKCIHVWDYFVHASHYSRVLLHLYDWCNDMVYCCKFSWQWLHSKWYVCESLLVMFPQMWAEKMLRIWLYSLQCDHSSELSSSAALACCFSPPPPQLLACVPVACLHPWMLLYAISSCCSHCLSCHSSQRHLNAVRIRNGGHQIIHLVDAALFWLLLLLLMRKKVGASLPHHFGLIWNLLTTGGLLLIHI